MGKKNRRGKKLGLLICHPGAGSLPQKLFWVFVLGGSDEDRVEEEEGF